MKSFGDIKNIRRFVTSNAKGININRVTADFLYPVDCTYKKNKAVQISCSPLHSVCDGPFGEDERRTAFLIINNSNFVTTMPKGNNYLNEGAVASLSSTTNARKASTSKTEKLLKQLSDKVLSLQRDNEEKDRRIDYLNYYIASRGLPALFAYFEKEHPIDSQDWGKLYKLQCQLNNI